LLFVCFWYGVLFSRAGVLADGGYKDEETICANDQYEIKLDKDFKIKKTQIAI